MAEAPKVRVAQAWIELQAEDPEAMSAWDIARRLLTSSGEVSGLKRLRFIELSGPLPTRPRLERLLHASIQFYNPHKERCAVRTREREAPTLPKGTVVVITERGHERNGAAERWWRHETGKDIEVREGVAWVLEGAAAASTIGELVTVRDRRHGLLCNPRSQEARVATGRPPFPWISPQRL